MDINPSQDLVDLVQHSIVHSSDDMDEADEHTEQEEDLGAESSELEETTEVPSYRPYARQIQISPTQTTQATTLWQYAQRSQTLQHESLHANKHPVQEEEEKEPDKSIPFDSAETKIAEKDSKVPNADYGMEIGTESIIVYTSENPEIGPVEENEVSKVKSIILVAGENTMKEEEGDEDASESIKAALLNEEDGTSAGAKAIESSVEEEGEARAFDFEESDPSKASLHVGSESERQESKSEEDRKIAMTNYKVNTAHVEDDKEPSNNSSMSEDDTSMMEASSLATGDNLDKTMEDVTTEVIAEAVIDDEEEEKSEDHGGQDREHDLQGQEGIGEVPERQFREMKKLGRYLYFYIGRTTIFCQHKALKRFCDSYNLKLLLPFDQALCRRLSPLVSDLSCMTMH
jgi:hypothetical protein